MNIRGRKVVLRAIEERDLEKLHTWSTDPALWGLLGGWNFPRSMDATRVWYAGLKTDHLNQRFAITHDSNDIIGTANIVDIDWKNGHAFHGMMLGDRATRGQGVGVDTIMAIMRYAFDELNLARLDGSMIEHNEASLRVYCEKCNWQVEGRQRNWYFRNGQYWDRIMVGVTRQDYAELLKKKDYWAD